MRRLDGLPLAIELAAARLHTLDVAEVAAGLDHRFRLLSSGLADVEPSRIAWARRWHGPSGCSTTTCSGTFADLSVFAGSFTAAEAVGDLRRRARTPRRPSPN